MGIFMLKSPTLMLYDGLQMGLIAIIRVNCGLQTGLKLQANHLWEHSRMTSIQAFDLIYSLGRIY